MNTWRGAATAAPGAASAAASAAANAGSATSASASVAARRSARQPATVHRQDRAMHVVRRRAGEEYCGARQVVRLAPAPGRDALEDGAVAHRVLAQRRGVVGAHVAGRDR